MLRRAFAIPLLLTLIVVAACGSAKATSNTLTLGSTTYNNHGTQSLADKADATLEVDSYYFAPTFLSGTPGQKLTLDISNDSGIEHNFSVAAQQVDTDIPAKGKMTVSVTFPASGVLSFFCKYHTARGMNGELLAGGASPQAPSGATPAPTSTKAAPGYTGY